MIKNGTVTVKDIAYDVNEKHGYTVYIEEDSEFVPYLVVTGDYNGNVLLLRKYLLDETMPYKENESHLWSADDFGAYYETSSIDEFVNGDFLTRFSPEFQDLIVDSAIEITAKSSLGVTGEQTVSITKKAFILSLTELNGPNTYVAAKEGTTLKFFADDFTRRGASFSSGDSCPYWTRTPETWETYTVWTISAEGGGAGGADIESGVRPAFCISGNNLITKRDDIVENQSVYVFSIR